MERIQHWMVDIETGGTCDNAVILEMAFARFDPRTARVFECHVYRVDPARQPQRVIDVDTVRWWSRQPHMGEVWSGKQTLRDALHEVRSLFDREVTHVVWQRGAFDTRILETAFKHYAIDVPWRYYNVRDQRTVTDMLGVDKVEEDDVRLEYGDHPFFPSDGRPHSALYDCFAQIMTLHRALLKVS